MKLRLDKLIFEKGFVNSREKARGLILAGKVLVNEKKIEKCGNLVDENSNIRIRSHELEFVSKGGLKLKTAIEHFKIDVSNLICMDVGASTGGFTDCLLKYGAKKVYAIDVGFGQLDYKLRYDPRVVVIERENIRYLNFNKVSEKVDLVTVDVSFISLTKVIPNILNFLKKDGQLIVLIKPQFEVSRKDVEKGGIVKKREKIDDVIKKISKLAEKLNLEVLGIIDAPIQDKRKNREILMHMRLNLL